MTCRKRAHTRMHPHAPTHMHLNMLPKRSASFWCFPSHTCLHTSWAYCEPLYGINEVDPSSPWPVRRCHPWCQDWNQWKRYTNCPVKRRGGSAPPCSFADKRKLSKGDGGRRHLKIPPSLLRCISAWKTNPNLPPAGPSLCFHIKGSFLRGTYFRFLMEGRAAWVSEGSCRRTMSVFTARMFVPQQMGKDVGTENVTVLFDDTH